MTVSCVPKVDHCYQYSTIDQTKTAGNTFFRLGTSTKDGMSHTKSRLLQTICFSLISFVQKLSDAYLLLYAV